MKKFKMPTAFTILFLIIIITAALTWIIPAGQYDYNPATETPIPGTYKLIDPNPQGFWEVVAAPVRGFYEAVDIIFFILVIGGYLGLVMNTGAIDNGIGAIVKKLKGRETIMIPILMSIFGLGGTVFGMSEETIAFYVLILPIFIAAGFDALTGFAVIFLGAGIGCLGSTVNPFATGIASGFAGVSIGEGIIPRIVILIILEIFAIIFVMNYAKRVKNDPSRSIIYHMKASNEEHFLAGGNSQSEIAPLTGKQTAVLCVFGISFFIMILGVIPWASKFDIYFFENLNNTIRNIPFLGVVLGNITPLGDWWFEDMTILFLFASFITMFIYGWEESKAVNLFLDGTKDLLGVVLIIAITRGIAVVMNAGGMTATVLHFGESALQGVSSIAFVDLSYIFFLLMSFLVPSTSGLAALSMPIMAPIADFAGIGRDLVITAYSCASGVVNLLTPTSGVLMGALAIARISYGEYIKFAWKFIVGVFLVCLVALSILAFL